ncbi:diiron oxygenase [Streptomyces sp. NPDC006703]|uniref:diiron oxygenase n=1 Tax=Streptomyces sp. NPDC006703 TaxID=3364759 RepID=UPI003693B762
MDTAVAAESHSSALIGLVPLVTRLSNSSRKSRGDVHTALTWPDAVSSEEYWLSPELSSCYGSEVWDSLSDEARRKLTRCELVNFFSISVDLERELVAEVAARIYTPKYMPVSEFLYDFLTEENDHMWLFSEFCARYAGGLSETGWRPILPTGKTSGQVEELTLFGRILIAEEICDWYNVRLAADERLPQIVRAINDLHHRDESRHIAFGRKLVQALAADAPPEARRQAGAYLERYVDVCVATLYNPLIYRDAGIERPAAVRKAVRATPGRRDIDAQLTARTRKFLVSAGLGGHSAGEPR